MLLPRVGGEEEEEEEEDDAAAPNMVDATTKRRARSCSLLLIEAAAAAVTAADSAGGGLLYLDVEAGIGTAEVLGGRRRRSRCACCDNCARPGSSTDLLSMAFQSIHALRGGGCVVQACSSFPRSVLRPAPRRKHLLVTTTIPFLHRVRPTFMRGCDFRNPALRVRTEDKIT